MHIHRKTYYVDLLDHKINRKLFQKVLDAYNHTSYDEIVHLYFSSQGGGTHWANAFNDVVRQHSSKTKITFTDKCQSSGVFILQEALRMGIATIAFPIDIMVHKSHVSVEVFGPNKYTHDAHENIVKSLVHDNNRAKKEPFYLALPNDKKKLYDQGYDIHMVGDDVRKYIDRMCGFVEKELKQLK